MRRGDSFALETHSILQATRHLDLMRTAAGCCDELERPTCPIDPMAAEAVIEFSKEDETIENKKQRYALYAFIVQNICILSVSNRTVYCTLELVVCLETKR